MQRSFLFFIIPLLLLTTPAKAVIFNNIPCKNLPEQALTEMPAPVGSVASIVCTPYGQMLRPAKDFTWLVGGGTPMIIPAQENTRNPTPGESAIYFTNFDVKEMTPAEKAPYLAALLEKDPDLAARTSGIAVNLGDKQKIAEALQNAKVYQITASTSYLGFGRNMYFFESPNAGVTAGQVFIAGEWRFFSIARSGSQISRKAR